jgi:hypothetical protein
MVLFYTQMLHAFMDTNSLIAISIVFSVNLVTFLKKLAHFSNPDPIFILANCFHNSNFIC